MSITYRPISEDEWPAFMGASARANSIGFDADEVSAQRSVLELERSLAALDGSEIVGTDLDFRLEMTVPGGTLPAGIVSWVSVVPTHRRQGILTEMKRRQLSSIHERGEPLAGLWASESAIYGRFGYGAASHHHRWKIDRIHARFGMPFKPPGRVRFVTAAEARKLYPGVYDRVRPRRPAMLSRDDRWWDLRFWESKPGTHQHVILEKDGRIDGYAMYRLDLKWQDALSQSTLRVIELMAATDEAAAALWRYCFDIDLVETIRDDHRPADDPLPWMLADPRRLRPSMWDALWVRVVDVEAALAGRRYAHEGRLGLEIGDPFCPWNTGTYRLEGGLGGAHCRRTGETADITMSAADLATIYLGAVAPSTLAAAGRVHENTPGALATADAMFKWGAAPWCPSYDPVR